MTWEEVVRQANDAQEMRVLAQARAAEQAKAQRIEAMRETLSNAIVAAFPTHVRVAMGGIIRYDARMDEAVWGGWVGGVHFLIRRFTRRDGPPTWRVEVRDYHEDIAEYADGAPVWESIVLAIHACAEEYGYYERDDEAGREPAGCGAEGGRPVAEAGDVRPAAA